MAILTKNIEILVIEDNPGDYLLIEEYLLEKIDRPELSHTETLAETVDILQNGASFDTILLDLTLPDASGESLLQRVIEIAGNIPVIVLTGYENEEFGLRSLNLGIADYLLKDELNPFLLTKSISYSIERNRINRALKTSEQKYRDIFNLSPQPMWVYDLETLAFLDVNKAAIDHYGYSREEFLDMTLKDIRPPEDIPKLEKALKQPVNKDQLYFEGIFRHRTKDGEVINVEIKRNIIEYRDRRAKMVLANDITEQLKAKQQLALSEQRFRSLVQDGSDLIAILDSDANYKYVAPTSEAILGIPAEEFIGNCALDYIHEDDRERIQTTLSGLVEQEQVETEPFRFRDSNGEWRWLETIVTNMIENPAVEGIVANSRDVTESIERERKLQESLDRYNYVTKATDDIIFEWNIVDNEVYWDISFREKFIFDENAEKYTLEDWANNVHPDDISSTKSSLNSALSNPKEPKWEAEYRFKKQDGSYATVFGRGFIVRDENGEAIQMIGSLQDITERKRHEEKLKELSLVASKTTDVIIMTDAEENITWVNGAFEELTGYSFDEAMGQNPGELLQGPETDLETIRRIAKSLDKRNTVQEVILNYSKSGKKYWLDLTIDPIFDKDETCTGFIAIEKDVTDQIERERKLKESVDRYDIVAKATSDTIWDLDLEDDSVEYNSNIYNMFGYDTQEVEKVGKWWRDKIHPEDRAAVLNKIDEVIAANANRFQLEYRFQASDGSYKYIYDRAFVVTDDENNPIRMIGAMQDITQQKKEQEWLKLFESAISTTTESVAILEPRPEDLPGRKILYVNEAFKEMTEYSEEDVINKQTLHVLNGPKTSQEQRTKLKEAMERWESCEAELINYKKNGEEFWIHVSLAPVQNAKGEYSNWVCVGRDITRRKEQEKELQESLKEKETLLMEVHHRVKNNLAIVSGMMQLQAFQEDNEDVKEKLNDSMSRIKTMGSIHELLYQSSSFSRIKIDQNIRHLISNMADTFQLSIDLDIEYNLQPIELNINQAIPCSLILNEVVTNIFKHAFKERNTGTLSVTLTEQKEEVHIEIKDNGRGLPDDFETASRENSLGLTLIDTLTNQLNAKYLYERLNPGVSFSLSFKKAEVKGIGNVHLK